VTGQSSFVLGLAVIDPPIQTCAQAPASSKVCRSSLCKAPAPPARGVVVGQQPETIDNETAITE